MAAEDEENSNDPMAFQTTLLGSDYIDVVLQWGAVGGQMDSMDEVPRRHSGHGNLLFPYRPHFTKWHWPYKDINTNTTVNELIRPDGKQFIDLPDSCRRLLVPMVKVYKTFLNAETGERTDLRIKTDYYNNGVNRVELEKVDFTRLGGNPAEVDSNINFNILLSARELGFYLKRQYPKSEQGRDDEQTRELEARGVAWIDLIKIDPGGSLELPDLPENVTNQSEARIRVEIGYEEPVDAQIPEKMHPLEFEHWKSIISLQKEEFYLSLFKHTFDFKSSGEVGLSIDFKASASAKLLDPKSDILNDEEMNAEIKELSRQRKLLKRGLKQADKDDEACIARLKEMIAEREAEIRKKRSGMRNRLLSQLYLGALMNPETSHPEVRLNRGTRIFQRKVPDSHIGGIVMSNEAEYSIYYDAGPGGEDIYEDISTDFGDAEVGDFEDEKGHIEQYVFIGDIVQAAIEIVAQNHMFGDQHRVLYDRGNYFSWIAPMSDERKKQMYRDIGIVSLGKVIWSDPIAPDRQKQSSLSTLPISLSIFREWFSGISSRNSMPIRDFIRILFNDFLKNDIFGQLLYDFDSEEDEAIKVDFSLVAVDLGEESNTLYDHEEYGRPSSVFIVQQNMPPDEDEFLKLPQLLWGQASRGIMEGVNFEREDIPGYAEARLFSDRQSTANNLAIREKYNATIKMLGNTVFLPGSMLNLMPEPLDLGFVENRGSIARSLGLGGVYVVHSIENQIDMVKRSWETNLRTKWESYGAEIEQPEEEDIPSPC